MYLNEQLYKTRLDCDVPRPLYLECRQNLLLQLDKQKYFFPALTPQFIIPANYPGTGSSESVFPSRLIYHHHHHQYYRPNHSLSSTCSAWPKLKHKFTDFQKSTFVQHRRSNSQSFVCDCTGSFNLFLFGAVRLLLQDRNILKGYSTLFAIALNSKYNV